MATMTFVWGDDWSGVYVNGTLCTEGHSIRPLEAVEIAIAGKVTEVESKPCNSKWLNDIGNLPKRMADVMWEQKR